MLRGIKRLHFLNQLIKMPFAYTLQEIVYFTCFFLVYYRPFSGEYLKLKDNGMYSCCVCGQELFSSECKYDSGCGWPAFYDITDKNKVHLAPDLSHGKQSFDQFVCPDHTSCIL